MSRAGAGRGVAARGFSERGGIGYREGMPELVWINGREMTRDEARVSAFDAAFQHGMGLFETMLATRGRIVRVEAHLARLVRSAQDLGLLERLRTGPLAEAAEGLVARSGLAEGELRARVRLTVTGGDLNLLMARDDRPHDPTIVISVQPGAPYPDEMFERGVSVVVADARANPLGPMEGHKSLNYWWRLRELQSASQRGAGEALILQVTNHVAGGAVSNVFVVRGGALLTPIARTEEAGGAIPSPVLPGITRAMVGDFAQKRGVGLEKRLLTVADVLDADEMFLTNSSWGVLPVVRVEGKEIGSGKPGSVTRDLRGDWLRAIRDEP